MAFSRLRLKLLDETSAGMRLTGVRDGGFREDSGFRQLKLNGFRTWSSGNSKPGPRRWP